MYTTESSAGSDSIAAQRQVSPHTNRYLVPGLSLEGGIFKEQQPTFLTHLVLPNLARMFNGQQQTTFLTHLVLPNLARMFNGQQQTTFLTQDYHGSSPKSLDEGPPG